MRINIEAILVIILALSLLPMVTESQITGVLGLADPKQGTFNLFKWTDASLIGSITYRGTVPVYTPNFTNCVLEVYPAPVTAGLSVSVTSKSCTKTDSSIDVIITISVSGTYSGGSFNWAPISSAVARVYNGSELITTVYLSVQEIRINEVTIERIDVKSIEGVKYESSPSTPSIGTLIEIKPLGTPVFIASINLYPSFPTTLVFRWNVGDRQGSEYIFFSTDKLTSEFRLSTSVSLIENLRYVIYHRDLLLTSDTIDLASAARSKGLGMASFTLMNPQLSFYNPKRPEQRGTFIVGSISVGELSGGRITATMSVAGVGDDTRDIWSSTTEDLVVSVPDFKPDREFTAYVRYTVVFTSYDGTSTQPISVSTTVTYKPVPIRGESLGKFLEGVFFILFVFILGAGVMSFLFGFFSRRQDLMSSGIIIISTGTLVFLIPTLMGYVIAALTIAGFEMPREDIPELSRLNMANLGSAVAKSVEYIQRKALQFAGLLTITGTGLLAGMAALTATSFLGGFIGKILTGGVLTAILTQIVTLMLTMGIASFVTAAALTILGLIYPALIAVSVVILLFAAIAYCLYAGVTGNIGPAWQTIISLSITIFLLLLAPVIFASLDKIPEQYAPPIDIAGFKIPNPVAIVLKIGVGIAEIILLAAILAASLSRAISAVSGALS